ncbi:hypothetical protein E3P77_01708 [Wallemia ichthyophaga]|nr:uncharacterized protein J056_004721 [Wallemia ichthyophaga EXF-994]TIA81650.1 hypothetical protein E3P98_01883 [Wallemia ichthyophaga]EOR00909.1 hypothetical protein J056_004721 [Wallemia ichthyophaga EXF-994]TIB13816.1 hypothetical protein E3P93_01798 [Wallemia ichthyophaga]TIB23194.1 hypothetical protein E3P89_01646 [Wallemia ichthyophaga]TIB66352.1 hypothetical protein E3P78_00001 [Wallemia ichthyophaga]
MGFMRRAEEVELLQLQDSDNPYLIYQPPFAYSLPSQMLVIGIVLTLCTVLLSHLSFTAQYHFPLSKLNFLLQTLAVLSLLTKVSAELALASIKLYDISSIWPYMFEYTAIDIPYIEWDVWKTGAWLAMLAIVSALVNLTHIQFLTLLFPSDLEQLLIFTILGPLAVVGAALTFCDLSSSDSTIKTAESIKNVCNSTLTLLFTAALIIWGGVINRRRAWRTDGGTAAFGVFAIALAVLGTAVNFLIVKEDEVPWLQSVEWAIVMWQSWLGFWWWVGAGMGIGEVEDRRARKTKKQKLKRRNKNRTVESQVESMFTDNGENQAVKRRWRSSHNNTNNIHNTPQTSSSDSPETSSDTFLFRFSPSYLVSYVYNSLKRAHNAAARIQAKEYKKKQEQHERRWGPGEFAMSSINPIPQHSQLSTTDEDTEALKSERGERSWFKWSERFRRRRADEW